MIGIYKITSPVGKIYIGQTTDWINRQRQYKCVSCKNQVKLYRSLLKYGAENHVFELIHECNKDNLNEMETYYGELFNSRDFKTGLNIRHFGSRGNHSDETKKIQSAIWASRRVSEKYNSIEQKLKRSNSQRGNKNNLNKKHSIETKEKIINSLKKYHSNRTHPIFGIRLIGINNGMYGRKHSDETKEKTSKIILNTQNGVFYIGTKSASESIGISRGLLSMKLRGERKNNTSLIYA